MNPQFRKVALIAASLGLIVSLFLALRPDDEEPATETIGAVTTTDSTQTTTAPPSTSTEPPATTAVPTGPVEFRIVPGGEIERGKVRTGREVRIRVTAEVADRVHVHGYDLSDEVTAGEAAEIEFEATIPGQFEIELEDRHQLIGVLEVGS